MKKGIVLIMVLLIGLSLNAVIEVDPDEFVLDIMAGDSSYNEFTITNIGTGTVDYNIGINYINGYGWVSLSSYSGTLGENDAHIVGMTINTSNLSIGNFESEVEITFAGDEIILPIYLTVLESAIESDPEEFIFEMIPDITLNEEFTITNVSSGTFDYAINVNYSNGYGWISLDILSGNLIEFESDTIGFTVDTSGLGFGTYESDIVISYEGNQHTIPVYLEVISSDADENNIVLVTKLLGNYPNPFNPTTTIDFSLASESKVTLEIYNSRGQKVKTLINSLQAAGLHSVVWNGTNDYNKSVSSGMYFYKFSADSKNLTKKMIMLK